MSTLIARVTVKDYGSWRQAFDTGQSRRAAVGLSNPQVFRSADDGNELIVVFDVSDLKKAKEFAVSPERKAMLEKNGVIGAPKDYFIE